MANARIAAEAVRAAWTRRRDGSHVSTVVIVPAFHSAPATDAPQIAAPMTRNIAAVSKNLSSAVDPPRRHVRGMAGLAGERRLGRGW